MPSTITLTAANIVADGFNSSLVYNFPNSIKFSDHSIAVSKIAMYYSWQNINAFPLANNTFQYQIVQGPLPAQTAVTVTIPDGVYEVSQLNEFLQFTFIAADFYLINDVGLNVYYAEFLVNPTLYAVQINTYPVPIALPAGWTAPAGFIFPNATFNPVITINANFNKIVGFAAGFATALNSGVGTILSSTSSVAPQVQPNPTVFISSSGIQNIYASPSSIIYSVTPTVAVGEQIVDSPNEYAFSKFLEGTYSDLRLRILGTDLNQLKILDPTMSITLLIRDNKLEGFTGNLGQQQYSIK